MGERDSSVYYLWIPLLQAKTAHIRESLQATPGPFPDVWVGPGDEAMDCTGSTIL